VNRHFQANAQNIKIAYIQNYNADYNQILHNDKDHQLRFVVSPNARKTNPRWRTDAILKNRKMPISPQRSDPSARNLARAVTRTVPPNWTDC